MVRLWLAYFMKKYDIFVFCLKKKKTKVAIKTLKLCDKLCVKLFSKFLLKQHPICFRSYY